MSRRLAAERVSAAYGSRSRIHVRAHAVLTDVSLEIRKGEIVGLVGLSGSGKSTLAKCMVGLVTPTGGTVSLDGVPLSIRRSYEQRRAIQMVFQNPYGSLDPRLTARDTLLDAMAVKAESEASALARSVGITERQLDARPRELSGGQCQRVSIARALATLPSFIIADEPVSALDASVQATVLELLRQVRDRYDVGIMFISHDLAVVEYISDRILVLQAGSIVDELAPAGLGADDLHPHTKDLMAARPRAIHPTQAGPQAPAADTTPERPVRDGDRI